MYWNGLHTLSYKSWYRECSTPRERSKSTHWNTNSNVYSFSTKQNLFVPRPNSNFMKRTFHYSGTIMEFFTYQLKFNSNIDLFKKKYTDYLMSKQNNEWLCHIHCTQIVIFCCEDVYMYCLKLYLLYLINIVLKTTWNISLLLLTVLPSWNKAITYLLTYLLTVTLITNVSAGCSETST